MIASRSSPAASKVELAVLCYQRNVCLRQLTDWYAVSVLANVIGDDDALLVHVSPKGDISLDHWSHVEPLLPAQADDPSRTRRPLPRGGQFHHHPPPHHARNTLSRPTADQVPLWTGGFVLLSTDDNPLRTLLYGRLQTWHEPQDLLAPASPSNVETLAR